MEARAGADPHRRMGRSCRGFGLAGAPEGEGRDTPGNLGNVTARNSFIRFRSSAEHPTSGIEQRQANSVFYPFRGRCDAAQLDSEACLFVVGRGCQRGPGNAP